MLAKSKKSDVEKVVIIGSGPAGLTAAIYAARANLNPIVISGAAPGGQLMETTTVDNFSGFPEGILGQDLMASIRKQAERFSTRFIEESVVSVDFKSKPLKIKTETKEVSAETVIIATGAYARWLGLDSERRLNGKGVSRCATCDGFFFKGKEVAVVGGGDTAIEEALFLLHYAKKVTIIHRRDALRASKIMQEEAFANKGISFIWNTSVEEILGTDHVEGAKLKNTKTGVVSSIKCDGIFVAIGHQPATDFLKGQIDMDENGYVKRHDLTKTNVEGVFVAGDVADPRYRQAITAAGDGCRAAVDADRYLQEKSK